MTSGSVDQLTSCRSTADRQADDLSSGGWQAGCRCFSNGRAGLRACGTVYDIGCSCGSPMYHVLLPGGALARPADAAQAFVMSKRPKTLPFLAAGIGQSLALVPPAMGTDPRRLNARGFEMLAAC